MSTEVYEEDPAEKYRREFLDRKWEKVRREKLGAGNWELGAGN